MERNFAALIAGVCIFTFAALVNITNHGEKDAQTDAQIKKAQKTGTQKTKHPAFLPALSKE